MKKIAALLLVITFALSSAPLFASYNPATTINDKMIKGGVESEHYLAKAPAQLLRGSHNIVFGWSEIVTDLFQPPIALGTAMAPVTGTVTALARTGSGVVDVLTFWIPGFRGWAV